MKSFTCCLVTKDEATGEAEINEDFTGVAISEHLVPMPDASSSTGVRFQAMIGVLWDDNRQPAPSYHSPEELSWLSIPELDSLDQLEEDNENNNSNEEEVEEENVSLA